jgi:hypothetical protein
MQADLRGQRIALRRALRKWLVGAPVSRPPCFRGGEASANCFLSCPSPKQFHKPVTTGVHTGGLTATGSHSLTGSTEVDMLGEGPGRPRGY